MDTAIKTNAAAPRTTGFLPEERAPREELLRQHAMLSGDPVVREILDASLSMTVILNFERQAVLINEALRARVGLETAGAAVGARFGEITGCRRAEAAPDGCGTSAECRACGLARATVCAQSGRAAVNPCRVQTTICGRDLCLIMRATPFSYKGEEFTLISAADIEHELRRRELEQIFFHDILNTASGVQGLLHFMQDSAREAIADVLPIARRASDALIDELLCQRDLANAENGDLKVTPVEVRTAPLLAHLTGQFAGHSLANKRTVVLSPESEDLSLTLDETLLSRVLVNLIKNALEAVPPGAAVTVSCRRAGGEAVFSVHNQGGMAPAVQNQVFQRSFSTKGAGRGLGTYSVRLLTENYLGGKVSFASSAVRGTTFRVAFPLDGTAPRPASAAS